MDEELVPEQTEVPLIVDVLLDESTFKELDQNINELTEIIKARELAEIKEKEILEKKELLEQQELTKQQKINEETELVELEGLTEKESQEIETELIFREDILTQLNGTSDVSEENTVLLLEKMDEIIEQNGKVSEADHVIGIYGLVVLPAVIIVFLLWKLIKPFLP